MPSYTVLESTATGDWKNEYGNFRTYRLKLDGQELPAELNQKIDSPPPTAGATLDLDLQPHPKFGGVLKAKKVQSNGGGGRGRSPEEEARTRRSIQMQHAQKCAVDALKLAAEHGEYKPPNAKDVAVQVKAIAQSLFEQVEAVSA